MSNLATTRPELAHYPMAVVAELAVSAA